MSKTKYTTNALEQKVDWEGGIGEAMEYGIHSDDIADEELASLWERAENAYRAWSNMRDAVEVLLEDLSIQGVESDEG